MRERETADQRDAIDEAEWTFWQAMSPDARLCAVWSLVEKTLKLEGKPVPRLDKSCGGVRPRKP